MRAAILRAVTVALNFVRTNVPESSARLCAVMLGATGCLCALGTVYFANRHPDQALTVTALGGIVTALIGAGCVAIVNRRDGGPPQ